MAFGIETLTEKSDTHLCGVLEVLAETRADDGSNWGVLLGWRDHDGRAHEWAMPRAMLAGDGADYRSRLLDGGLFVAPGRKARELLTMFLASARTPARARAVSRVGWHGRAFILPDGVYGETGNERILLQTTATADHAFRVAGTLDELATERRALCSRQFAPGAGTVRGVCGALATSRGSRKWRLPFPRSVEHRQDHSACTLPRLPGAAAASTVT